MTTRHVPRVSRKRLLQVIGGGAAAAALPATTAQAAQSETAVRVGQQPEPTVARPSVFHYDLEGSSPKTLQAGQLRTATRANIGTLDGLALFSERINKGGLRELHWHTNANELSYVISG